MSQGPDELASPILSAALFHLLLISHPWGWGWKWGPWGQPASTKALAPKKNPHHSCGSAFKSCFFLPRQEFSRNLLQSEESSLSIVPCERKEIFKAEPQGSCSSAQNWNLPCLGLLTFGAKTHMGVYVTKSLSDLTCADRKQKFWQLHKRD